jgi:predicted membrane-bound spermidine synthase
MDLYWNSLKTWMTVNLGDSLPVLVILAALSLWVLARRMKPIACFFLADTHSWFLFALGFAFMVGEIQLLQFYQGVSGMVYQFFGLLTAAFMLGLSGGAGLAMAFSGKQGVRRLWDAAALVWVAGMGVCFLTQPGFVLERGLLDPLALAWNLLGGLILGAVFSAETGFLSQRLENGEVLSSKLYAFDLFGSAAAALLAPMVLIPILGQALTAGFSLLGLLLAMVFTRGARYGT